jgi:hypothetical protein
MSSVLSVFRAGTWEKRMWNLTLAELVHRIEARFPEVPPTKAAVAGPAKLKRLSPETRRVISRLQRI